MVNAQMPCTCQGSAHQHRDSPPQTTVMTVTRLQSARIGASRRIQSTAVSSWVFRRLFARAAVTNALSSISIRISDHTKYKLRK